MIHKSNLGLTKHLSKILTLAMLAIVTALLLQVAPAQVDAAAPIPSGGVIALYAAIDAANASLSPTTITLAKGGIYDLDDGELEINGKITINGRGSTINGDPGFRIFDVSSVGDLTLKKVTVSGGSPAAEDDDGGGIRNLGTASIHGSTISENMVTGAFGNGGGISNEGTMAIYDSTISGNTSGGSGGGIANGTGDTLTIHGSTIWDNMAPKGGGIHNLGTSYIDSSRISGNTASQKGGGLSNGPSGTLTIYDSTIWGNMGG